MSGTIKVDLAVQADNGVWSLPFQRSFEVTQGLPGSHDPLHYLTTTEEEIDLGELSSGNHLCVLFNVGDEGSPTVEYGPDGGGGSMVALAQIQAGRCALLELKQGATLMAKSVGVDGAVLWPIIFEI